MEKYLSYYTLHILLQLKSEPSVDGDTELADPTGGVKEEPSEEMKFEAAAEVKTEQNSSGNVPISTTTPIKKEPGMNIKTEPKELREKLDELQRQRAKDNEVLKDLRAQLKKAQTDVKEMKGLFTFAIMLFVYFVFICLHYFFICLQCSWICSRPCPRNTGTRLN